MGRRPLVLALALATITVATAAHAQGEGAPRSDAASAQHFFQRGRELSAQGDEEGACRAFAESLRLESAVGTLFNLAHCEQELGRLASAWQHLQEGIERLEPNDPRRGPAVTSANALDGRVPRLTVRLARSSAGARVFRDDVELSAVSLGTPLPVDPGRHVVVVRASGHADARVEVEVAEGEKKALDVARGAAVVGTGAPTGGEPTPSLRTPMWISAGTTVVALGAGLVTGGFALERSSVVDDHCKADVCDDQGKDALATGKTFGTVSTVAFVTAGVAAAATVVFWVLGRPRATTESSHAAGAAIRF